MNRKIVISIAAALILILACYAVVSWPSNKIPKGEQTQNATTSPPIKNKAQSPNAATPKETASQDCSKIPANQLEQVKASGIVAQIIPGKRLCPDESAPYFGCARQLKITLENKTEKILFISKTETATGKCWDGALWHPGRLALSPNGRYLFYETSAWETSKAHLYDIKTDIELINEGESNLYFADKPIWSINNEYGALATQFSTFGGEGITAIYVITNGSPRIKKIWDFPSAQISFTSPDDGQPLNARVKELRFTDPETIYFEIVSEPQAGDYKTYKYSYNIRTAKLIQQ